MRWTAMLGAFAVIGSLAGFSAGNRHPDVARSAYLAFSSKSSPAPAVGEKMIFRVQGACPIPVVDERVLFKGGLTSGEQISIRLDTAASTFRLQVDAVRDPGAKGHVRSGHITLDEQDCSLVLSGDQKTRIAINRDGVLFGSIDADGVVPIRIIAFSSISNRLADLAGDWRIVSYGVSGFAGRAASSMKEARIRPDGTYSRCSLTHVSPMHCVPNTGRIALGHNTFTTIEADGNRSDLIVGIAGDRLIPILLRPEAPHNALQFLLPQSGSATAAVGGKSGVPALRHHAQVVSPIFHR